jgi:hypothetical protein
MVLYLQKIDVYVGLATTINFSVAAKNNFK